MAKRAGLPWDCVLSAEVFKAYKPDPRTYLGVAGGVRRAAAARSCWRPRTTTTWPPRAPAACSTGYIERPHEFGAAEPKDVSPRPGNTLHARDIERAGGPARLLKPAGRGSAQRSPAPAACSARWISSIL